MQSGWPAAAFHRHQLPFDFARSGAGGPWVVGVPPGIVEGSTYGVRRPLWVRAVVISAWGRHRLGDRPFAGRLHRRPAWQSSIAWFSGAALLAILLLSNVSAWYSRHPAMSARRGRQTPVAVPTSALPRARVVGAIAIILILLFSKNVYTSSLSSYYTFYLIEKFQLSVQHAQYMLFAFLGAVAAGTFAGGPIGDRFGRKPVIWFSILGAFPFALMLPYASLLWTGILSVVIGLILASAFSAIIVYAQELLPGRIGLVAGMMFGFSFGLGGLGAAALGRIADATGIETVYRACSFLPLIGLLTAFLPDIEHRNQRTPD
jgi:FSR family fosmidomycin resistance protein-like MFS transporter